MEPHSKDSGNRIEPIAIRPDQRISTFSPEDLDKIHQATLTVLWEAGVSIPDSRALKVFEDAGAAVDRGKQIVRIPPDLLMDALAKAPRSFTMASRCNRHLDIVLDGQRTYCGTDGTGTTTVDLMTREKRPSTKADVAMMAKVSDSLPCVSFYWPMVSAQDVPEPLIPLHEIEASFSNTEKHVHIISCAKPEQAVYAAEMAQVVSGDSNDIKKRPPLSMLACPISPLSHDGDALEAALTFARKGLPVGFATMPMLGSTAPASIPGLLVAGNAELLSAICYIQLVCPGAPVYYAFFATILNPYTGGCVTSTEHQPLLNVGVIEIGHYYDLPVMCSYGAGDSRRLDSWRTGKELSIDTMYVYLHQPDMIPGMGLIDNDTLMYPEHILFDQDIYNTVQKMAEGITVTPESLAIDEILAVGPGGHFLDRASTRTNIRKLWTPGITRQWSPENADLMDPYEAATQKIQSIVKNHEPNPLGAMKAKALQEIIKAAEKEMLK